MGGRSKFLGSYLPRQIFEISDLDLENDFESHDSETARHPHLEESVLISSAHVLLNAAEYRSVVGLFQRPKKNANVDRKELFYSEENLKELEETY